MLLDYALVQLNDAKSFLDYTGSDSDMEFLINAVTEFIEGRTQRRFKSTTYTQERYDGSGNEELFLNQYPIITMTLLEKSNVGDNSNSWESIDSTDYWVDEAVGMLVKTTNFVKGKENYRATYTAGFATIPYDIQFLAMSLIDHFLKLKKGSGIKSESLGDHSITFEGIMSVNPMLIQLMNRYRKIPLAS
jgi:hypothetical protein